MNDGRLEKSKEYFKAFWAGEALDRCALSVTAPLKTQKPLPAEKPCTDMREYWTNPQRILERNQEIFDRTFWGGEAFQRIWVNLGPGITAAYLGSSVEFRKESVWFSRAWSAYPEDIRLDPQNAWWQLTQTVTRQLVELTGGKLPISITDLSGTADIISHLRGTENLCIDILEEPEEVIRARDAVCDVVKECFDTLYALTHSTSDGCVNWLNLWAPGTHFIMQCDLSTMLSKEHFDTFFLPEIERQCEEFAYPMYHLDGPGEIKHLDSLLEVQKLKAIQWVPLPEQGSVEQWMPLYKKIRAAGKSLYFAIAPWYKTDAKSVEYVLSELPPEGLFLDVTCQSQEEAEWILKNIDYWSSRKHRAK